MTNYDFYISQMPKFTIAKTVEAAGAAPQIMFPETEVQNRSENLPTKEKPTQNNLLSCWQQCVMKLRKKQEHKSPSNLFSYCQPKPKFVVFLPVIYLQDKFRILLDQKS